MSFTNRELIEKLEFIREQQRIVIAYIKKSALTKKEIGIIDFLKKHIDEDSEKILLGLKRTEETIITLKKDNE